MPLTTYIRDTQKHIFSVHNLGGVPLIYATVSRNAPVTRRIIFQVKFYRILS